MMDQDGKLARRGKGVRPPGGPGQVLGEGSQQGRG